MATPGLFFGKLTMAQKEEVLRRVGNEASQKYQWYFQAVLDGVGLHPLTGVDRLQSYQARLPDIWARLQMQFPQEYQRQMKDWGKLEQDRMFKVQKPTKDLSGSPLPLPGE